MTRGDLEQAIWGITGRQLTGAAVDAILDAAERYTAERMPHVPRRALHHVAADDLYPVIGVLAGALLGECAAGETGPVVLEDAA